MQVLMEILQVVTGTVSDVLPIAAIIFAFQFGVLRQRPANLGSILAGFVWVLIGLSLFLLGLQWCLFPLGRLMAEQLTDPAFIRASADAVEIAGALDWQDYYWVYIFAFLIGFSTTIAEPSLIAVAIKANDVSGGSIGVWGLRIAVALGVAVGISLGCYRIVVGDPIHWYIITGYVVVVIQTAFAPKIIIPLAYDSGGVTTSTVTVPLVAALGLGLSETVPGRNPLIDGFGLIAFASLFPIMSVMGYAQLSELRSRRGRVAADPESESQHADDRMHFKMIIVFVEDAKTDTVMDAAREAGATGATVINNARGEGLKVSKTFFGLTLETQRDVVMLLVEEHLSRHILEEINRAGQLDAEPGTGIAFQLDVEDAVGVVQQAEKISNDVEDLL